MEDYGGEEIGAIAKVQIAQPSAADSTRSLAQALANKRVLQAILCRGTYPRHNLAADPRDYGSLKNNKYRH